MGTHKASLLFLSLISLAFSADVHAQAKQKRITSNFKDGVVVTQAGDTLQGQIDYREWIQNPTEITFLGKGGEERQYAARELQAFRVEKDVYHSRKVDLDVSPHKLDHLSDTPIPTVVKDTTLFLRLLVGGAVDLYAFQDISNKEHFFYQQEQEPAAELILYRYYQNAADRKFVSREIYKGQLKVLLLKCDKQQLDYNIDFNIKDFVALFKRYNACLSGDSLPGNAPMLVGPHVRPKADIRFVVIGGMQFSRFDFYQMVGDASSYTYEVSANDVTPAIGLGLNYTFPRGLGKYGINFNILYNHQQAESKYGVTQWGRTRGYIDEYELHTLQFFTSFRYSVALASGLKPFFTFGPSLVYFIDPKLKKYNFSDDSFGYRIGGQTGEYGFQKLMGGASLGIGVSLKKFSFEARFHQELANGHSGDGHSRARHFSGLLSYTLF